MTARVHIIDVCNSARMPNIAIGYLVANLRDRGYSVSVISPLSVGVKGYEREEIDTYWTHLRRRIFFSTHPFVTVFHDRLHRAWRYLDRGRLVPRFLDEVRAIVSQRETDILLVSAYLDHHPTVKKIGRIASDAGVPLLLGGPAFNLEETVRVWWDVPGLVAIIGAEVDITIGEIVGRVLAGEAINNFPGVHLPDGKCGPPPIPFQEMSQLPIPDYRDFPWQSYEHRILPVMAGRGCEWAKCVFCSDVKTVNGVSFRSRETGDVLDELRTLRQRHDANSVFFVDIKLNSELVVWRGIIKNYQSCLPGGSWVGVVHVDNRDDNGLSASDLDAARKAGMVRISCGLETGSQTLNNRMSKGTSVARIGQFFKDAHAAGISTRTTMMLDFPGETTESLGETMRFLEQYGDSIDRIQISRFTPLQGTEFETLFRRKPELYPGLSEIRWDHKIARGVYKYDPAKTKDYRRAKTRVLQIVHQINAQPLPAAAEIFNGLM